MFHFFLSKIKLKHKIGFLGLLASLVWLFAFSFPDQKLKIIFCDVGQGDAILIQKGFVQILIDGGPNIKVLGCLSNNIPFWDRTIEVVVLTHPQVDHMGGLNYVLERYTVRYFLSGPEGSSSAAYAALISNIKNQVINKKMNVINLYLGDKIKFAGIELETLWPERNWVQYRLGDLKSSIKQIGGAILGASTDSDLNDFSLVFLLKYGDFSALFTGDADVSIQEEILLNNLNLGPVKILKVPHHGAKNALKDDFLEILKPQIAVISVGKNSYGHPNGELIKKLENMGAKVRRTDLEGDIKFEL